MTRPLLAAAAALCLGSTAFAADLSIPNERFSLDNGLDVVLAPDHSSPIVHVQVWYHVGSKDERKGLTGFAHLFEHLMFQGSFNAQGEYFTPILEIGGTLNGTTNSERTNYFETVPAAYLPLALFMEADRMGNLLPVLDQAKLDNQRDVVRNERRQRYENPPYGEAFSDLAALVFPEGHPYHHPTIGSHEDLQAASLDDVKAFFRTWYVPNNATLVITGDFDPATARELVQEQFGWIARGPQPTPATAAPVQIPPGTRVEQERKVPDTKLWLAWVSPSLYAEGDASIDLATSLLCEGRDSRLVASVVHAQGLARDLSCFQYSRTLSGMFLIEATVADGHTPDEVIAAIQTDLAAFEGDTAPSVAEVQGAVTSYEADFYRRLLTIQGKAGAISSYLATQDQPDWLAGDLERYLSQTPESVTSATQAMLSQPYATLIIRPLSADSEAK